MRPGLPPDARQEPAPWRAARLLDAPHRLCFFAAGLNWAGAALWWSASLFATARGVAWPWQVNAASAHGLWFSLGAMPLFIAGFMFTAGPKWLRRPPVVARELRLPVAAFTLGWVITVAGFHLVPVVAAAGLAVVALGWGGLTWRIVRLVANSTQADRRHPRLIVLASSVIVACLGLSSLALLVNHAELLHVVLRVALWGGVCMVFLVVSHRLLPFLSAQLWPWLDTRWPDWPLWVVVSVPLTQCVSATLAPWPVALAAWRPIAAAHLAVVAALCLWIVLRWTRERALRQPLVAMLFAAFVWWDVALWLGAAAGLPGLRADAAAALELAALHTLTMGFLGGTLLVMATRVSSTHSGRPVAIDRVARGLFGLLQLALLLRLAAALAPSWSTQILPWAGLCWMLVAVVWAVRHGRWLGSARVDGRPG